jgi:hypothetical protein
MARPRIEIDFENFKKLCGLQCTLSEIASFFTCSEDTIERWCKRELNLSFADAFKMYSVNGKISLRRWQFKMAEHNVTMAIWLGKQWLGQTDKREIAVSDIDQNIVNEVEKIVESCD